MPSILADGDEWSESAYCSSTAPAAVSALCCSPLSPSHRHMFARSPPPPSDRHQSLSQPQPQPHPSSAASYAVQQSSGPSAFFPYSVQPVSHRAAPQNRSLAAGTATALSSPSSSPVSASASTASTASSSSSTSPQLHPLPPPQSSQSQSQSRYPFSAFAAPPPPVVLAPSAYVLNLTAPARHEEAKSEEDSPPASPIGRSSHRSHPSRRPPQPLLLLDSMDYKLDADADGADDDMAGHSASTPVTSLIAAARASFATAPPNSSLGPGLFLSNGEPHSAIHGDSQHSSHASTPHSTSTPSHGGGGGGGGGGGPQRISKACEACRRRKRKCDGVMPQCTSCTRVGSQCLYPQQTRRRGPQAGMVQKLRAQVNALESELHKERSRNSSAAAAAMAAGNIADHANIGVLLARDGGEQTARSYINTYFDLLNSTLFPFLVQSHFEDSWQRYAASPATAPPVWHLTVGAVLAQGAGVSGDMAYSDEAAIIARAAAAPLLDQPSADVIRGLLLLSYHCLSCNQLSRVSCFLAVATRMCAIVEMSPEVPLLCRWLEDMLCAIRTWWRGLRTMPEGSYQKEQRERFPADWARYERLSAYLKVHQKLPPASSLPTHSSSPDSSSSSSLSLTGPPDAADLDDSNIRWEVLSTLGAVSEARGEYNQDTHLSVYHQLCVLSKAQHSRLTSGAVGTTIAFLKCQALFFVNEISAAVEFARVCTRNMLTHDASHCAFLSLVCHFMCQVHLKTSDYAHLAIVLSTMRSCAARWKFAEAPLRNIEQLIQRHTGPEAAISDSADDVLPSDRDDFEPEHSLPQADRTKAEQYYHSSVIPHHELKERNRKRKLELEDEEAQAASRRPPSPAMLAALRTKHSFPSLAETIAGFHPLFRRAFHVSAGLSRGGERMESRTHSPLLATSREAALQQAGGELRSDHPHPHLSSLTGSTFTLKREEIDLNISAEQITAAPVEEMKEVAVAAEQLHSASIPESSLNVSAPPIPSLPSPATMASVAPPLGHQLSTSSTISNMSALNDTYAIQASPYSTPAYTAISSNAYSASYGSPHLLGYAPPDPNAVSSYYPLAGAAYSSPGLHSHSINYSRQNSLESVASAASFPFPYAFDAQAAMDGSNPAGHFYRPTSMELQLPDDGSAARHASMAPSLSNAPPLSVSHSTPVTAMYMPLPSPDVHQSYAAQTAAYFNAPVPQLPHAQSAPQSSAMAPYVYQPPSHYAQPFRPQAVTDLSAAHGHFNDPFSEQKRRLSGSSSRAAR